MWLVTFVHVYYVDNMDDDPTHEDTIFEFDTEEEALKSFNSLKDDKTVFDLKISKVVHETNLF